MLPLAQLYLLAPAPDSLHAHRAPARRRVANRRRLCSLSELEWDVDLVEALRAVVLPREWTLVGGLENVQHLPHLLNLARRRFIAEDNEQDDVLPGGEMQRLPLGKLGLVHA